MKRFLILFLLLITELAQAQTTGSAYVPVQRWTGSKAEYKRVIRNYATYPVSTSGNNSFTIAINNGTIPTEDRIGPDWVSARITYLESKRYLQVEAKTSANVQLMFERVDGTPMAGANPDGVLLQSGVFYGNGPTVLQDYTKQWAFDRSGDGSGGVYAVPIRITFKNTDTQQTYSHVFTPIDRASRAQLFVAANTSPPILTPSWLSARYSYIATDARLDVEAAGEAVQLEIDRVDGLPIVAANPENPVLTSGVFYGSGPLTGQGSYDKQWRFNKSGDGSGGIPTVPLRLTFKRNSTGETYATTFTPTNVTRLQLFNASSTSSSCDFSITSAPLSATCGQAIVLTASASGANASGLTYTWTGNGVNLIGQSVATTAPYGVGSYAYTVTASKAGCTNRTATATVTVTGCTVSPVTLAGGYGEGTLTNLFASAPFVPSSNQLDSWPTGGAQSQFLQNGIIKAGFMKGLNGAITFLGEATGANLINLNSSYSGTVYVEGQKIPEVGREAGFAAYASPDGSNSFTATSDWNSGAVQATDGIGWNGVVGGSIHQDRSLLLFYERRYVAGYGDVLYFKTQPQQWSLHNVLCKAYIHSFYWLEGRALKWMYIFENFRDDTQMKYTGRGQEFFAYLTAPHYRYFMYDGNSPGTSSGLTQFNTAQPCDAPDPSCNQYDTGNKCATEAWMGGVDNSGHGVFVVTDFSYRFNGKQGMSWSGDETSNAFAYINSIGTTNLDIPGPTCTAFQGAFYVGNLTDFRPWYNSTSHTRPFSWNFTPNTTQGWYSGNAAAKYNGSGEYELAIGQRRDDGQAYGSFNSPWGAWKASDIPTLYIKVKSPGVSQIKLQWIRPGETVFQSATNNRTIAVNPDGNVHTYAITMSGYTNWSGYISQVSVSNVDPTDSSIPTTAKLIPVYIGNQNPN